MKKQSLLILLIILGGSSASIIYASGTTITNTSVTTPTLNAVNVNVSGTCTGCGGGEGSFTNYNTVVLNTTAATSGTENDIYINSAISNLGDSIFSGNEKNVLVKLDGTTKFLNSSGILSGSQQFSQSETGKYVVIKNNNSAPAKISVFKNGIYMQDLGIKYSQVFNTDAINGVTIAISPDGHYILVVASDSVTGDSRLLVFEGS